MLTLAVHPVKTIPLRGTRWTSPNRAPPPPPCFYVLVLLTSQPFPTPIINKCMEGLSPTHPAKG